jgi:hypothetical protein
MRKIATVFLFVLAAGLALFGSMASAEAHHRHHCCGPIPPTYTYDVVNKVSHVTRYHDVWSKHYVHRTKLYVHVTKIHPIVYVHNVTRVHHQTVEIVHPKHVAKIVVEATTYITTSSVVNIDDGCVREGW